MPILGRFRSLSSFLSLSHSISYSLSRSFVSFIWNDTNMGNWQNVDFHIPTISQVKRKIQKNGKPMENCVTNPACDIRSQNFPVRMVAGNRSRCWKFRKHSEKHKPSSESFRARCDAKTLADWKCLYSRWSLFPLRLKFPQSAGFCCVLSNWQIFHRVLTSIQETISNGRIVALCKRE